MNTTEDKLENLSFELGNTLNFVHDILTAVQKTPMDPIMKNNAIDELFNLSENINESITSIRKIIGYLP